MPLIRIVMICALAAASTAALACGASAGQDSSGAPTQSAGPPPELVSAPGHPIVIGVSVALSGDQRVLGEDIADAAELAAADVGPVKGHAVTVARRDDGCQDPEKARGVADALIEEGALGGVVGPMCAPGIQAAGPRYEQAGVPYVTPSATRADLPGQDAAYFFRTAWRDDVQAQVQAAYAIESLSASKAVVIDDGQAYGQSLAAAFAEEFRARGGRVVSRERIEPGTQDFAPLSMRVKGAAPDVVVFQGGNPEAALIVRDLRLDGYAGPFMAPDAVMSERQFIEPAGPAGEGAIVTGGPTASDEFIARFRDRFQREPATPFVLQAYDAMAALLRSLDAAVVVDPDGTLQADRTRMADTLRSLPIVGQSGIIDFDAQGERSGDTPGERGLVLYKVVNGRFERIE